MIHKMQHTTKYERRASTRPKGPALHLAVLLAFAAPASVAAQGEFASTGTGQEPAGGSAISGGSTAADLAQQVEVLRTSHGVPHIRAENLRAAGYAMGYVQLEDYGAAVVQRLIRARGELGVHYGRDSIRSDFDSRHRYAQALRTYGLLEADTRDMLEGFAIGVNRYIELHPAEFIATIRPDFSGHDVHAMGLGAVGPRTPREFLSRVSGDERYLAEEPEGDPEDGSNAWALAPSRTTSGNAILLRNPHLRWSAGYYEAHVTVPGKLDFYGDFRIGGPLGIIGGFNRHLGWATTNNYPDLDEIYALRLDPARENHYLLDGRSHPLSREVVQVEFVDGMEIGVESREYWASSLGPVVHRDDERVYVLRYAGDGEFRTDEQFLKMMMSSDLDEWRSAVMMRARTSSNLTYADADGNIYYVWNATVPRLPHPSGGDSLAIPVSTSDQVWQSAIAFDSLPQLLNPRGGYVRNENDPPFFTSAREPLDPNEYPANIRNHAVRLRSQHSLELLNGDAKFSLEDVVRMKHSMRMLLADRVKDDLVAAVRSAGARGEVARAIDHLAAWDNTVAADSRGGVLFRTWWERYRESAEDAPSSAESVGFQGAATDLFSEPWDAKRPLATPRGVADPARAAEAFEWAVAETARRYGTWDIAWGDVHRVRRGDVDVPVGGCSGLLGCFRVLSFADTEDGKHEVVGGDGWVLAVEFGRVPRAYSVLAYGESARPDSPFHDDQAAMFAANEMKPVAFTPEDVERQTIRRYRPGGER